MIRGASRCSGRLPSPGNRDSRYQTFHSSKESVICLSERRSAATASAVATTRRMKVSIAVPEPRKLARSPSSSS